MRGKKENRRGFLEFTLKDVIIDCITSKVSRDCLHFIIHFAEFSSNAHIYEMIMTLSLQHKTNCVKVHRKVKCLVHSTSRQDITLCVKLLMLNYITLSAYVQLISYYK